MILYNQWIIEEFKLEIKKIYILKNEYRDRTIQKSIKHNKDRQIRKFLPIQANLSK